MLDVSFDGFWDVNAKKQLESALKNCLSDSPADEVWHLLVSACVSVLPYHRVVITTPRQRRACYFDKGEADDLARAICSWLKSYPLR